MAIAIISKAFKANVGNPLRKLILIKLADNANDEGWCWPSMRTIAMQCECSVDTVRRHVRELEKIGFLSIHPVIDSLTGQRVGTKYKLKVDAMSGVGGSTEQPPSLHRATTPPCTEQPPSLHRATLTVKEPSIEPSRKPSKEAEHADACSGPVAPSGGESEKERELPSSQKNDETHENPDTHEIKAMKEREDKRTSFLNSSFRGKVPDDWLELARQHGLSKREAAIEADKFEMWFRNDKGKRKLRTERGWRLTWRKWIAKHDSYTPERIAPLFDGESDHEDWG